MIPSSSGHGAKVVNFEFLISLSVGGWGLQNSLNFCKKNGKSGSPLSYILIQNAGGIRQWEMNPRIG